MRFLLAGNTPEIKTVTLKPVTASPIAPGMDTPHATRSTQAFGTGNAAGAAVLTRC